MTEGVSRLYLAALCFRLPVGVAGGVTACAVLRAAGTGSNDQDRRAMGGLRGRHYDGSRATYVSSGTGGNAGIGADAGLSQQSNTQRAARSLAGDRRGRAA